VTCFILLAPPGRSATPGLVAAFSFDEGTGTSVADASGNGNTGTITNATWTTTGKYGKALTFNGTSSRVNVSDATTLHLSTAMTLEAWVNPTTVSNAWRDVIYKGSDYFLEATSTGGSAPAGGGIFGNGSATMTVKAPTALTRSTWSHIALTYNGATLRFFVNGTQVATQARTGAIRTSTNPLQIGSDSIFGQYFSGLIDEVRVYNRALTAAEIQSDMNTPLGGGTDNQPPTAPGTLTATAINSGRVDLSWGAATDNVGVTGYRIERCIGAGCTNFAEIAAPPATGTTYNDTGLTSNTTYSYRVRATDAATNFGPYSNTATAVTPTASGPTPVAAYGFDEGSGSTVSDASGGGNTGSLSGTTWAATGKFSKALSFNGSSSRVTVVDKASLRLSSSMTLEAWVNPSAVSSGWRDVIFKGNDDYYLEATSTNASRPAGGAITGGSGGQAYGTSALQTGVWTHVAVTYDGTALRFFVNGGQVSSVAKSGAIQTSTDSLTIGSDPIYGQYFQGSIDEVRVYNTALTAAQIQIDMTTPITSSGPPDTQPPAVAITAPVANAQVSNIVNVTADASDNVGVIGVQFLVDGVASGVEDPDAPYGLAWDTRTASNGAHTLTARARDAFGNTTTSAPVTVNVANSSSFQNEVLATGFDLPTSIEFLPDGRMLVVELAGKIKVLPPPYTQPDPTPFLQISNIGSAGVQQGIYDIALDPDFTNNHYYYVFYTLGSPNRDRLSRFTANASLNGTIAGSELVLYQDPQDANAEHHGGAIVFGNDGKLYFTTGEHFDASASQLLTSPRGKIHRINKDGTIPTDNPFYDGGGPNVDSIWARGLRNPYRAYYDAPTGRFFIGDVGGNDNSTSKEEVELGVAGANYGWPNCEGSCGAPYTDPIYSYPHSGRDACVTGGFVYHGSQFPSAYKGAYFFADYTQNWIKFMTFDGAGNVSGVFNFEPADGSVDGPYGDIVYLTEGPDGALYYVDLGYSDVGGTFGVSKIRRIRFLQSNQAPIAVVSSDKTSGPAPLTVNFSSAGSSDPEGQPLTYAWTFGDGGTSTAANPSHTYTQAGRYTARLSLSDGTNTTLSTPITISAGTSPTATILTPQDGATFRAGDVISFSGNASDLEDGTLPASAYTWNIDFLHEGHVHPGTAQTGVKSGTFTIPTTGHDFSGNTRYRIALTVIDSDGLTTTTSVIIWPQKVNLTFNTVPAGLTLYLDGIAKTTPFVYDTLIGFNHTIEARNQSVGTTSYTFASWSDSGAQMHTIVVPSAAQTYTASYNAGTAPSTPGFVQVASSTPQTNQTTVATAFPQAQGVGDLNVVVIGWNSTASNISSVTDSRGNVYQVAADITRSGAVSQAIYYTKNVAAGANTVTVTMSGSTPYVDVRIAEYSGLDLVSPFDVTASASGNNASPSSGAATTRSATELLVGAGTTTGSFTGPGSGYTTRIITTPDADILEDRVSTTTGSYTATAAMSNSSWVMQLVAFRAAGQ
jgi:glucose/arabinose dehydrogenase